MLRSAVRNKNRTVLKMLRILSTSPAMCDANRSLAVTMPTHITIMLSTAAYLLSRVLQLAPKKPMFPTLRFHTFTFFSLFLLCIQGVSAESFNYFGAEVPVESQSRSDQKKAAQEGLMNVLVRISGSEAVRRKSQLVRKAKNALSLVSELQYADLEDRELKDQGFKHLAKFRFSERLVRKLLADAELPVWSVNRPQTLVWLVEDSAASGKQMMPYDKENPLFSGLEEASYYRGMPLVFPLLDLDDQVNLSPSALWALDEKAIVKASARYNAGVILVGKFSVMSSGRVVSSWQYIHAGRTSVYNLRGDTPKQVGYDALLPIADLLASKYSYHSANSEYFSLVVERIETYADYRGLINGLTSFDSITDVKVDAVAGDQVALRFKSQASLSQVKNQIAMTRKLTVVPSASLANTPEWQRPEAGSPENPLRYRWR